MSHSLHALYSIRLRLQLVPIVPPLPKQVEETPNTPVRFDKAHAVSRMVVFVSGLLADAVVVGMFTKIHYSTDLFDFVLVCWQIRYCRSCIRSLQLVTAYL